MSGTASFVANLRGQGDLYTDYYPHGGRAPLSDRALAARRVLGTPELTPDEAALEVAVAARFSEINVILARPGWRLATTADKSIAGAATRRDLASWEARAESATPDWAAKLQAPRPPPTGAIRLLGVHPNRMTEAQRERENEIATQALPKRLYSLASSGRISEAEYREMVGRIAGIP